jgi:Skp family chaperone for outer membrane proteins
MPRNNTHLKARFDQLGWVLAAAIAGVMLSSGFQGATDKTGVVDLGVVVNKSNQWQASSKQFDAMKTSRQSLLDFVAANPVVSLEQAQQLHDLSIKDPQTDADRATITKIEADVTAACKSYEDLSKKKDLTADEKAQVAEYSRRAGVMLGQDGTFSRWKGDFQTELEDWSQKHRDDCVAKAKDAIGQTAKGQGYTLIFDKASAPYGANDLTDAALQAMNAQK